VADRFDLDHVALAAPDTADTLRFLTGRLGGRVIFGGHAIGFRPMQVWLGSDDGDGMPVELLEPWEIERNDFLARFVARHGAGPHHLTFKVPDFAAALARVRGAGFNPVNIDRSDPQWHEMFLMPREAHGTVVQLAATTDSWSRAELLDHVTANGPNAHPRWWVDPDPPQLPRATLRRVVLRTPSLVSALSFFAGLLQGDVEVSDATAAELVWESGARIRLEEQPGGTPGVDRLEVEGLDDERELIGTRFVPAPKRS
jgi:methylmalonyl-CoA/ethylmalonyl-CoA epimerase